MRSISATISAASGGRPTCLDFHAQNRANPRRCQPITVAGFTIASASDHRDQTREATTQKRPVDGAKRRAGPFALQDCELLAQDEVLGHEVRARTKRGDKRAEQR